MSGAITNFLSALGESLSADSFVKLTLSNYKGAERHAQRITARVIETKRGRQLSFQVRNGTRETVENHELREAVGAVQRSLDSGFRSAHLFTTASDFQLTVGKKSSRLVSGKPTFTLAPSKAHDREKVTLIDPNAYYLKALGITNDLGEVRSQQRDKWRQIVKYLEVLRDLFERSELQYRNKLRIVDMGSGKGYLTFAAYDYFSNARGLQVEMTGVEARQELVDLCNQIAASAGYDGLHFTLGTIVDTDIGKPDILIALHACDTATDDALFKGISADAEIIVAAPCCHKEIRRQMKPPDVLKDILKYGSMAEREAETITDGLRAMLLERSGYATKVFEFVPTEHTPKNNMIVGVRNRLRPIDAEHLTRQIKDVKAFYGVEEQRLENLLA